MNVSTSPERWQKDCRWDVLFIRFFSFFLCFTTKGCAIGSARARNQISAWGGMISALCLFGGICIWIILPVMSAYALDNYDGHDHSDNCIQIAVLNQSWAWLSWNWYQLTFNLFKFANLTETLVASPYIQVMDFSFVCRVKKIKSQSWFVKYFSFLFFYFFFTHNENTKIPGIFKHSHQSFTHTNLMCSTAPKYTFWPILRFIVATPYFRVN